MRNILQGTIFDLEPDERIALLNVLIQQLNSYHKFRALSENRIAAVAELRRELKSLRIWDAAQVFFFFLFEELINWL